MKVFEVGHVLGGKYRIEHQLASGGMGKVVAATHIKLGIKVALKFLREDFAKEPKIVERFVQEAQAAAQLRSENVCRVSDVETTEDGLPYIVMELLQGRDLQTIVKTAPLETATAALYLLQAALAIAEAHSIGIVHRDLKPANLFLTYRNDGTPLIKVLDFGIAKAPPKQDDHGMTQTQTVIGSPGYMSPEQLRSSKTVDARSDIWSLGIVIHELVIGHRPWKAESITELTLKVANDPVPTMPAHIPAEFQDVILRCLKKEASHRYQNIAQLAKALAPFAEGGEELAKGVHRVLGATATGPVELVDPAITGVTPAPRAQSQPSIQVPPSVRHEPTIGEPTTLRTASAVVSAPMEPPPSRGRKVPRWAFIAGGLVAAAVIIFVVRGSGSGSSDDSAPTPPPPELQPATQPAPPPPPPPTPPPAEVAPVDSTPATTKPTMKTVTQPGTKPTAKPGATKPGAKPGTKKRPTIEDVRDSRM